VRSRFGRRVGEVFRRDWLEIGLTALGLLFLALFALCVWALVVLAVNWSDPTSGLPIGRGMLETSKGAGLAVFSVGAVVTFAVGWSLAGSQILRRVRAALRGRRHDA
jgi:TRAP-type C4-dicarboxylate transport system permease small subunit